MEREAAVELAPITDADVEPVAAFLHTHLNSRVSAASWARAMRTPWSGPAEDHGYLLRRGDEVVGACLAFYSERVIDHRTERFCNLGAWCVLPDHRTHGLRLVRSLLRRRGYTFTDLSPSGAVVPLNERLGFTTLDTTTAALPNLPWPALGRRTRVSCDPWVIERTLRGRDLVLFQDHRHDAAARHLVLVRPGGYCYVVWRRDRRKGVPAFGSLLHVSHPEVFHAGARRVASHLLWRHGVPVTLAELRVVGRRPRGAVVLPRARPRMYRSDHLRPEQIDYLYSELTSVAW